MSRKTPIDASALDPAAHELHKAVHEAGHAVVGVTVGFQLLEVDLAAVGFQAGGVIGASTKFAAPNGDQNELARQHPDRMAVVLLAGFCAEEALLGRHIQEGWYADVEILRKGHGWLDPMTSELQAKLLRYVDDADEAVRTREHAIRRVADALLERGRLSGSDVAILVERQL